MAVVRHWKTGPPPSCLCGECATCHRRVIRHRHWVKRRAGTVRPYRKAPPRCEPSDEAMDLAAAAWLQGRAAVVPEYKGIDLNGIT